MKRILWLVYVLCGHLLAGEVIAANHYVRAGASGNGSGADWTNASNSLPATLVRGDTYYVAAGAYAGATFSTATSGTTVITIKKATVSDHGTATGWVDAYGTGQATFSSHIWFESSYWVFDGVTGGGIGSWNSGFGFKITETGDASAILRIGYSNNGIGNITIRHVDLQGKGSASTSGGGYSNDGIAIYYNVTNVTLSFAWMHGIGRCPIFMTDGASNSLFEGLYVQSYNGSSGAHSEVMSTGGGSNRVGNTTFRNSLVTDLKSTGGLMWDNAGTPTSVLSVYGNVFYKPAGASWDVANGVIGGWTGNNGEEVHNILVYNNTFINIDQEILSTLPNVASGNVVRDNIFYNSQSPNFAKFGTHDYNHFINSGGTHSEVSGTAATSGDPFVDYVNLDFRLKAPTTAGTASSSPSNLDPAGIVRGADGVWDRGAVEFNATGVAGLTPPSNLRIP